MKALLKSIPKPVLWIGLLVIIILVLGTLAFNPLRVLSLQARAGRLMENYIHENAAEFANHFTCQLPLLTQLPEDQGLREAVLLLTTARSIRPQDPQTNLLLGRAYCLQGDFLSAIQAFNAFTQAKPDNPLGELERAFAHYSLAQVEEDLPEVERAAHLVESRRILEGLGLELEDFYPQEDEAE